MPDNDSSIDDEDDEQEKTSHHTYDKVEPLMRRVSRDSTANHPSAHQPANPHVDMDTLKEVERLLGDSEFAQRGDSDDSDPDPPRAS